MNMKHEELVQANKKVVEVICSKLVCDGIIDGGTEVDEDHMKRRRSSWPKIPAS